MEIKLLSNKMDYFQTLPADLLRQTALSLPPSDIINLSLDSKFNYLLTDKFWEKKFELDLEYFNKCLPYLSLLQIQEKPYNEYLYLYYRCLGTNPINREYKITNLLTSRIIYAESKYNLYGKPIYPDMFPLSLKLEIEVRNKLIKERGENWPQIYFANSIKEINNSKDYDMVINEEELKYIILDGKLEFFSSKNNFELFQPLFDKFKYSKNNWVYRKQAITQIYLIDYIR